MLASQIACHAKNVDMQPISPASSEDIVENVDALVRRYPLGMTPLFCRESQKTPLSTQFASSPMIAEAEQNIINETNARPTTETISDRIVVGNPRGSVFPGLSLKPSAIVLWLETLEGAYFQAVRSIKSGQRRGPGME